MKKIIITLVFLIVLPSLSNALSCPVHLGAGEPCGVGGSCCYHPTLTPSKVADQFCYPVYPVKDVYASDYRDSGCDRVEIPIWCATLRGYHYQKTQEFLEFNTDRGTYHVGEDWNGYNNSGPVDKGDPVYAVANGVVVWTDTITTAPDPNHWGKTLVIRHTLAHGNKDAYSVYAHMELIRVKVGDQIDRGDYIATIGDGNGEYPPHLHFTMLSWIPSNPSTDLFAGHIPGYVPTIVEDGNQTFDTTFLDQYFFGEAFQKKGGLNLWMLINGGAPLVPGGSRCALPAIPPDFASCNMGGGTSPPLGFSVRVKQATGTEATFIGVVNPNGYETEGYFIWDDDKNFDFETSREPLGSGNSGVEFEATIPISCGGKTYYVKAVGESVEGVGVTSVYDTFVSPACTGTNPPPAFSILSGTRVKTCAHSSSGGYPWIEVPYERKPTGNGTQLYYDFYRNDSLVYTMSAAQISGTSKWNDVQGGLYAGKTYTYRIVARDSLGDTPSTNSSSVTLASNCGPTQPLPVVVTLPPEQITGAGGYLVANVQGNGPGATLSFEWGDTTAYGETTEVLPLSEPPHLTKKMSKALFGLACGTTYHYRAKLERPGTVTQYGSDQTLSLDCPEEVAVAGKHNVEVDTVALWHMDGPYQGARKYENVEGTLSYDLTPVNNPTPTTGFSGEPHGAFRLEKALTQYFSYNIPSPEDKNLTWMGWVNLRSYPGTHPLITITQDGPTWRPHASLSIVDGYVGVSFATDEATRVEFYSDLIQKNAWTHVAVTREAGLYSLYLNGALAGSRTSTIGNHNVVVTSPTYLGYLYNSAYPSRTDYCDCDLDEWHLIYGRSWSAQEVANYYASVSSSIVTPDPIPTTGNMGSVDLERDRMAYLKILDSAQHGLDITGDITLETWFQPETYAGVHLLVSKWGTGNLSYALGYEPQYISSAAPLNMSVALSNNGTTEYQKWFSQRYGEGQWWHIAASCRIASGGGCDMYVNGVWKALLSGFPTSIFSGSGPLEIGTAEAQASRAYDGKLDEIRIWNYARSSAEIVRDYRLRLSGSETGLAAYYQFDDPADPWKDSTGNQNHLTPLNTPEYSTDVPFP